MLPRATTLPASLPARLLASARRRRWSVARLLGAGLVAALVWFHAVLLWERIASLTLFQPMVAVRWAGTLLLLAAFLKLHRAGVSLLGSRKALILWLLVVMLHASMAPAEMVAEPATGVALALSFSYLALRQILAELRDQLAPERSATTWVRRREPPARRSCAEAVRETFSPRPPPSGLSLCSVA